MIRWSKACRAQGRQPWWETAAQVGQAAWFFGNLYEGLVGMPQLLADTRPNRSPGLLAVGSPVRYFVPVAAVALVPTGITLIKSWRADEDRRLVTASAASVGSALALSVYLIRTINIPLLLGSEPFTGSERDELVARWHRVNTVRLVALSGSFASLSGLLSHRCLTQQPAASIGLP